MEAYSVRGLLADPGQVIAVKESLDVTELANGGELIPLLEPCQVEGVISNVGGEVLRFDGAVKTRIQMACARCNKPVELPLQLTVSQRFARKDNPDAAWEEDDTEPITNDRVDLEDVIFHEIQLSIPMKVLCREDCKGLCPVCGQDLNVGCCHCETRETDPRWDALKDLLDE